MYRFDASTNSYREMPISAVNFSTEARLSGGKFAFDHAEVKESGVSSAVFIAADNRRRVRHRGVGHCTAGQRM
jgi:FAD/FMN-containing dehydrogenase